MGQTKTKLTNGTRRSTITNLLISQKQLDSLTEKIILKIQEKYWLVEKTLDLQIPQRDVTIDTFMEKVIECVCKDFSIDKNALLNIGKGRFKNGEFTLCEIRYIAYKLCREIPKHPIPKITIAGKFNKSNHSTVVHGLDRFESLVFSDSAYKRRYEHIKIELIKSLPVE